MDKKPNFLLSEVQTPEMKQFCFSSEVRTPERKQTFFSSAARTVDQKSILSYSRSGPRMRKILFISEVRTSDIKHNLFAPGVRTSGKNARPIRGPGVGQKAELLASEVRTLDEKQCCLSSEVRTPEKKQTLLLSEVRTLERNSSFYPRPRLRTRNSLPPWCFQRLKTQFLIRGPENLVPAGGRYGAAVFHPAATSARALDRAMAATRRAASTTI